MPTQENPYYLPSELRMAKGPAALRLRQLARLARSGAATPVPLVGLEPVASYDEQFKRQKILVWSELRAHLLARLERDGYFKWVMGRPGPRMGLFLYLRRDRSEEEEYFAETRTKVWYVESLRRKLKGTYERAGTALDDLICAVVPPTSVDDNQLRVHLDMPIAYDWGAEDLAQRCVEEWHRPDKRPTRKAPSLLLRSTSPEWRDRMAMMAPSSTYQSAWPGSRAVPNTLEEFFEWK